MTKLLLSLFFIITMFLWGERAFAESSSCGVEKSCKPGYYCLGAIGESESGVCTANALNISLCRFLKYIRKEILGYLFLFGAMFGGVMMWIGKFTMTTMVQILLGIGVIQGAQGLIIMLAGGQGHTICTTQEAKECASGTTGTKSRSAISVLLNLSAVSPNEEYNPQKVKCDEPFTCFRAKCDTYTKSTTPGKEGELPSISYSKKGDQKIVDWVPGTDSTTVEFTGQNGGDSISVKCDPYYASYTRDYFSCTNPCTGVSYGAEASTTWNVSTCAELALRNIK